MSGRFVTQGVGELTPQVWSSLIEMSEFVSASLPQLSQLLRVGEPRAIPNQVFLARITGNRRTKAGDTLGAESGSCDVSTVRRWIYSWERAVVDSTAEEEFGVESYAPSAAVPPSSTLDADAFHWPAMNLCEAPNTDKPVTSGPGLLNSFPMPIGEWVASSYDKQAESAAGTTETIFVDVVVPMMMFFDASGNTPAGSAAGVKFSKSRFYFYALNAQGGMCYEEDNPLIRDHYKLLA